MKDYKESDAFRWLSRIQQEEKLTLGSPASLLLNTKDISIKAICLSFKITEEMLVNDLQHYIEVYSSGIKSIRNGSGYLEYLENINKVVSLVVLRYLGYCSKFDLDVIEEKYENNKVLDTLHKAASELDNKFGCSLNIQYTILRKSVSANYIKIGKYLGISPVTAFKALSLSYPDRSFGGEILNVNVKFRGTHYNNLRTASKQTWVNVNMLYDAYKATTYKYNKYAAKLGISPYDGSDELDITQELCDIIKNRYNVVGYTEEIGPFLLMTDDDYKKIPSELIGKIDWSDPKTWAYYDEESRSCYTIVDKFEPHINEDKGITYISDREADEKKVFDISEIIEDAERYGLNRLTTQFMLMVYFNYWFKEPRDLSTMRLDEALLLASSNKNKPTIRLDKLLLLVTGKLLVNGKIYSKFADFPFSKAEQRLVSKIKFYSTFGLMGTTNQENIGLYAKLAFINQRFYYNTDEYGLYVSNIEKLDTMYSTILRNANEAVLNNDDVRNRLKKIALNFGKYTYRFAREKADLNEYLDRKKKEEKLKREKEQAERKTKEEARWKKHIAKQCATDYVIVKSKAYKNLQEALDAFGITQVHQELVSLPGVSKSAFVCFHIAEKNGLASYKELSKLTEVDKAIYIKNCIQLVSKL